MKVLAKTVSLLLIVIAATGSPAWCWPAPASAPTLSQPLAQLANAGEEGGLPIFLIARSTPLELGWLARRSPLAGLPAVQDPAVSSGTATFAVLPHVRTSAEPDDASNSLVSLCSQLTV